MTTLGSTATIANAPTHPALAAMLVGAVVGVHVVEWVPRRAVRYLGVVGRQAFSTYQVFAPRNWLQVLRIDAMSNAAQVVKIQSIRDGSAYRLIGNAVRSQSALVSSYLAVSLRIQRCLPKPTVGGGTLINLRPKEIIHSHSVAGSMP